MKSVNACPTGPEKIAAWRRRDATYDGVFFLGVKTTGIFCRPSCPSQPKLEHLEFFGSGGEAVRAGYRPCFGGSLSALCRVHPALGSVDTYRIHRAMAAIVMTAR